MDARLVGNWGIGTYLVNLLPRLIAQRPSWRWTLLGDRAALGTLGLADNQRVRIRNWRAPIHSIREQLELAVKPPRDADLFWSPNYNVPLAYTGRLMVTVHDLAHLTLPQFSSSLVHRLYAKTMFGAVKLRASAVLCDSAFTRDEYLRLVGAGRAEPLVVHLGIDPMWGTPRSPASPHPRPYVVSVGVLKAHKNVGTLIRAFGKVMNSVPHDLIVIGRRGGSPAFDAEVEHAAEPLGARVLFAGELPFDNLRNYVAHADAFANISLYEGFGLTPLEAMAAGPPCLVSNVTAHAEMCGDAALYCDPRSADDVAAKLSQLLGDDDLRSALRVRGRRRAATFSWQRCAEQTADAMSAAFDN